MTSNTPESSVPRSHEVIDSAAKKISNESEKEDKVMTRVFVLTNHKGGVGKTTSATTIALGITSVLRQAGAPNSRVLLVDTDSQGHATLVTTGRNDYGAHDSLYAVLMADRQAAPQVLANCIVSSTWNDDLHAGTSQNRA